MMNMYTGSILFVFYFHDDDDAAFFLLSRNGATSNE